MVTTATTSTTSTAGRGPAWTADLEHLLLLALQREWRGVNEDHFGGVLKPPVIILEDTRARLGQWRRAERVLSISLPLARERPWHIVRAVLKHEVAHQYVAEILGQPDDTAHGPAFLDVCARRGIDARASGLPDDDAIADDSVDDDAARVMRRVQKLLSLAQSDNPHEADAAANAAQRLMLEHNIAVITGASASASASAGAAASSRVARNYRRRRVTEPRFRLAAHEKMLAGLLGAHYFVEVVIARAYVPDAGREGFVVELSGTAENLAMAEWIWSFLLGAADRAFAEDTALRGGDRRRYLAGFIAGVGEKLRVEKAKNEERGLVWLGDKDLRDYVRREHPRLGAARVYTVMDEAHERGRAAGRDVVIARPVDEAPSSRGRMLRGRE